MGTPPGAKESQTINFVHSPDRILLAVPLPFIGWIITFTNKGWLRTKPEAERRHL
jgi:hypothetical protein